MTSRAVILPYPGDPFLLHYWLKFFDEVWGSEVDKLYVYLNSPIEKEVVDYIRDLCARNPKINFTYNPQQIEHGDVINRALDIVTEEYVMLVEDDGFIFKKGMVDQCFRWLESGEYDIVGSKRGSCSMEILSRASMLWGISYTGEGDQGCNFWPNFFFTKKQTLLATDRRFGARTWKRGEEILPLSRPGDTYLAQDELVTGDTFVNTSLQLQATFPQNRIKYVPQYHGSPDDLEHSTRGYNLWDDIAPWCHIGSLSSGVGGILVDDQGRSLARRMLDEPKGSPRIPDYCHTDQEKNEWERRAQWWLTFWENREPDKINEFANLYHNAVYNLIGQYDLSMARITRRQRIYKQLGL